MDTVQKIIDNAQYYVLHAVETAYECGRKEFTTPLRWSTDNENIEDGSYVGVLPDGGKVFVSATGGKLYPVEYCKKLVKWLKLPE